MLKSSSLLTKLVLIFSLLILVLWSVPNMLHYYESVESYEIKRNELQEACLKYNISENNEKIKIEALMEEMESLFSKVKVDLQSKSENEYAITLLIDKNKIKKFNTFIETLSLRYLVKVKDNELHFEEKDQLIEVIFILDAL